MSEKNITDVIEQWPRLADCYPGKPADIVRTVTLALAADVFCLPLAVQKCIAQDEVLLTPFDADLFHVVDEFGDCGILYVNKSNSKNRLLKDALKIGQQLYLTKEHAGIPVKEYLFYLLKGRRYKRDCTKIIREWSGISTQQQDYVYRRLVGLFRTCLRLCVHKDQLKYAYAGPFDMPREEVVASGSSEEPVFDQVEFQPGDADAGNDL